MRKKHIAAQAAIVAVALIATTCCLALISSRNSGTWPKDWPKELEPLREQSRTIDLALGIQGLVYEIPFKDRDTFEAAWPHILSIKSKGAHLVLLKSPASGILGTMEAGVRIHHPVSGLSETPETRPIMVGPPWPKEILDKNGILPEYVVNKNGEWAPSTGEKEMRYRARIDIELVVDGEIVDLNRIPLPPDVVIIDRRFTKKKEVK